MDEPQRYNSTREGFMRTPKGEWVKWKDVQKYLKASGKHKVSRDTSRRYKLRAEKCEGLLQDFLDTYIPQNEKEGELFDAVEKVLNPKGGTNED